LSRKPCGTTPRSNRFDPRGDDHGENTDADQAGTNLSSEPGEKSDIGESTHQRAQNLSPEHQREGDARFPSDTLDRGQPEEDGSDSIEPGTIPGNANDIEIAGEGSTTGPSG